MGWVSQKMALFFLYVSHFFNLYSLMSFTVTLVRHGNTDANNERWLQGHIGIYNPKKRKQGVDA